MYNGLKSVKNCLGFNGLKSVVRGGFPHEQQRWVKNYLSFTSMYFFSSFLLGLDFSINSCGTSMPSVGF